VGKGRGEEERPFGGEEEGRDKFGGFLKQDSQESTAKKKGVG